jgi:hypothetical protein
VFCLFGALVNSRVFAHDASGDPAKTVHWDGAHLAAIRSDKDGHDAGEKEALTRLRLNAEGALRRGPYSVMQKQEVPPSGDKHDYLSYARYWWPNPDTATGLPYVRRDGHTNEPLLAKGDRVTIGMMYDDVETLALAGYLLNEPRSSEHAARLVRAWFLDPATRMNPHMRYGQAVPGLTDGRGSGIIDTRHFIRVLDSVALLKAAGAWPERDQQALVAWMKQYLDWLRNDPQAHEEHDEPNNHGTWYDAQCASIAMFVGERELAKSIVQSAKRDRIARCIEPDGSQPKELARTKGLHYCVFNLSALSVLARIGEQLDVDLWHDATSDGRSIRRGLDFVMPYLLKKKAWPHEQITEMSISTSDMGLFYMAARRYHEPAFLHALQVNGDQPDPLEYVSLQFPDD